MQSLPKSLKQLIFAFRKFSSVGQKSAERFAFELFEWKENELAAFAEMIRTIKQKFAICDQCFCIKETHKPCFFCDERLRNPEILCIVSHYKDPFLIEESKSYNGLYHVLPHLFSPFEEKEIHQTNIDQLISRIRSGVVQEIILALDTTLEGDATALYFQKLLQPYPISLSRLAYGIPMGSNIHYFDSQTLHQAMTGRRVVTSGKI